MFCSKCGKENPAQSPFCGGCGVPIAGGPQQQPAPHAPMGHAPMAPSQPAVGGPGFGIAGMVVGILCMLMIVGSMEEGYTPDEASGLLMFTLAGLGLSAVGLTGKRSGRGAAIGGLVMGILAFIEWASIDFGYY
jgi:hypothetical protein